MSLISYPRIFPLGDDALTLELGDRIDPVLNEKAIAIGRMLDETGFPGYVESVPAYCSITVFYDIEAVSRAFPAADTAFDAVESIVRKISEADTKARPTDRRLFEIPVKFSREDSPDLQVVAAAAGLEPGDVIDIFLERIYRVYMLGFLPGFAYMAEVDERIATPRRETPRTIVPKGSVGIAGSQTGIYSLPSPGGWQIIGRTDVELFRNDPARPSLLMPGDSVRFTKAA